MTCIPAAPAVAIAPALWKIPMYVLIPISASSAASFGSESHIAIGKNDGSDQPAASARVILEPFWATVQYPNRLPTSTQGQVKLAGGGADLRWSVCPIGPLALGVARVRVGQGSHQARSSSGVLPSRTAATGTHANRYGGRKRFSRFLLCSCLCSGLVSMEWRMNSAPPLFSTLLEVRVLM